MLSEVSLVEFPHYNISLEISCLSLFNISIQFSANLTISGFDCVGQDLCSKTFSTPTHVTYTDSSVSTENTQRILGIKATPIQIRFEASDSTAVPIPTESFKLPEYTPPKKELSKREKAAIVAGSIASTVLLSLGAYFGWKHWKQRKYNSVSPSFPLDDDPPPPYTK
jgi:hypothetical protein